MNKFPLQTLIVTVIATAKLFRGMVIQYQELVYLRALIKPVDDLFIEKRAYL